MKLRWHEASGYILIVIASCSWGGAASLGKRIMQAGISTVQLMQFRSVISAVILILALLAVGRRHLNIRLADIPVFLLLSIPGLALVNASYYYAVKVLPVAIAVFVQFTAPVFIFLYGWMTRKEAISSAKLAALALCITGTYFMVQLQGRAISQLPWIGLASAFVSTLSYCFYVILSHRLRERHSAWTIVAYGYGFASLFWCLVQSLPETSRMMTHNGLWTQGILFALFSTLLPFVIFLTGLRRVSPTGAAIASTSETVCASGFAFLFLGERLTAWQTAGAGMILTAILLLILKDKAVPAPDQPVDLTQ